VPSWTDRRTAGWADAVRDVGHLLRFRAATVRRPARAVLGAILVLGLTLVLALVPAQLDAGGEGQVADLLGTLTDALDGNLGPALAGFLLLAIGAAVGSGGGRELLSRSEAAVHPVSPVTEHLGALVLTPLNLAWLVQVWGLLAVTALLTPAAHLAAAQAVVLLWVVAASAIGQGVGWAVEGVRRTAHGVVAIRVALVSAGVVAALLHLTGHLADVARALPTTWLADQVVAGRWAVPATGLALLAALAVWVGSRPAGWALGLPPREELRVESGVHEARHAPTPRWLDPDLALLRRLDRGSVWRSVGMRRGLVVLGTGPGLVALLAGLDWSAVMMLPGLAASGAALLFGVNAWCLDGKGMVWRETLPVAPARVFDARALVLGECLLAVSAVTVVLALMRNGPPPLQTGLAVATCWAVVVLQVLAIALSWSVRSPYGVDLSSPRATPAPHAVMAGYAGRLSLVTTLTGILFSGLAVVPVWWLPLAVGAVFLGWSSVRLLRARRRWLAPAERARVALTVAAV
jgi:hypothetical protein